MPHIDFKKSLNLIFRNYSMLVEVHTSCVQHKTNTCITKPNNSLAQAIKSATKTSTFYSTINFILPVRSLAGDP